MYLHKELDTLVGVMAVTLYQGEDYHSIEWSRQVPDDEVAVIHILAVSPDRQGSGIGSKILGRYSVHPAGVYHRSVRLDCGRGWSPALDHSGAAAGERGHIVPGGGFRYNHLLRFPGGVCPFPDDRNPYSAPRNRQGARC